LGSTFLNKQTTAMNVQLLPGKCTASNRSCLKKLRILALFSVFTLSSYFLFAQEGTVTGRVTNVDSPLVGATVTVKGTATATQTDQNGNFSISASPKSILVFSSVGYLSQEIAVGNRKEFSIQLKTAANSMSEVVVVGYGSQRRATVSGAVSSIQSAELLKTPATTTSGALVGKVQGITARAADARPGSTTSIQIRNM